jgi:hypothetical protein
MASITRYVALSPPSSQVSDDIDPRWIPYAHGEHVMAKSTRDARPVNRFAKAAVALEMLLSIGALGGGLVLMIAPRGEIMPLPLSALAGSPFDTYFVPGLILFGVLGLGPLIAAALALRGHWLAPLAAIGTGATLLAWLTVEIAIVGYSNNPPLQPFYLLLGIIISMVGLSWLAKVGLVTRSLGVGQVTNP